MALPDWLGIMDLVTLAIVSVILVAGAIAITWARRQATRAERDWQERGKPAMDEAARAMEEMHARLGQVSQHLRATGDAVVARVRKDAGRR